jgi:hypothetical protein
VIPTVPSVDFQNTGSLNNRRLFLAFGKPFGAFAVDIDTSEALTVMIVNGNLPMAMLAPTVPPKPGGLLFFFDFLHYMIALASS